MSKGLGFLVYIQLPDPAPTERCFGDTHQSRMRILPGPCHPAQDLACWSLGSNPLPASGFGKLQERAEKGSGASEASCSTGRAMDKPVCLPLRVCALRVPGVLHPCSLTSTCLPSRIQRIKRVTARLAQDMELTQAHKAFSRQHRTAKMERSLYRLTRQDGNRV